MRWMSCRPAARAVLGALLSIATVSIAPARERNATTGAELALASSAAELKLAEGLAVAPIGLFGRSAAPRDLLLFQMAMRSMASPGEGVVVGPNDKGERQAWKRAAADRDGWLQTAPGAWLRFVVRSERARTMILEATGFYAAWIGGVPRGGEKYGADWIRTPVRLAAGRNELLFKGERGRFRGRLVDPPAPVFFTDADMTLPDVVLGEPGPWRAGLRLVNATGERLTDIRVASPSRERGGAADIEGSIAPLAVRKLAVPIALDGAPASEGPIRVMIRATARAGRDRVEAPPFAVELKAVRPSATHSRTFVSEIDRSVQYFGVVPRIGGGTAGVGTGREGAAADGGEAPKPALVLTLHGASVEAIGQARAYAPKDWAVIAAATNRRPYGFDWEDWGRLDALEVLAEASRLYDTDPARRYLTGHSMGGHGTWQVGVSVPDLWAAVAPSAGWRSFSTYGAGVVYENPTPVEAMLARAGGPGETEALARNLLHYGVYVLHGDADDNVPVTEARAMRERLGTFHPDFAYYERPGAGHWWGNECVDWPPLFDFLKARVRPADAEARRVEFVTANPGIGSKSRWLEVLAQVRPLAYSRAAVERDEKGTSFKGTTENVLRLALDVPAMAGDGRVTVELDGAKVVAVPVAAAGAGAGAGETGAAEGLGARRNRVFLERGPDGWKAIGAPAATLKNPLRSGGFKDAFRHGVVLVYGTRGDAAEDARGLGKARFDAETFWARGNNGVEVLPDVEFRGAAFRDRNVVLYGNADTNSAWRELLAGCPVEARAGSIRAGERSWTGPDLAAYFVRPRPGSDVASVGAVAWTGASGWAAASPAQYFISGAGFPDLLIFGADELRAGVAGIRGIGWFGDDWSLARGDFVWR